jgi:methyl-accepting chemotaxis protein
MSAISLLGGALRQLSEGDLTRTLDTPFVPSMEQLRQDFNTAIKDLAETMKTIGENASAIAAGSREIGASADSFSKRTEQQAASVEETAAALEEITTTVNDSSRRADEAGRLVAMTKQGAEQSGVVVSNAVAAMGQIEQSSREITNIISVIDDIAFQTNLLALNAGVEAARAGETGKGFAVVAQEVRELAQRSAKAAKEIKALINTSGEHVRNGVGLVGRTGKALEEIAHRSAISTAMSSPSSKPPGNRQPASRKSTRRSIRWIRQPSRMPRWSRRAPPPATVLRRKPKRCVCC